VRGPITAAHRLLPYGAVKRLLFALGLMLSSSPARADPPLGRSAWVHVESPAPVRLERMAPGDFEWRAVCSAPCDVPVDAGGVFRVAGDDVRSSPSFVVHPRPGERVDIRVQRSSKTAHTLGIAGIVGGSLVASTALTVALGQWLGAALQGIGAALGDAPCALSSRCTTPASSPPRPNLTPALVTAALAGVVAVAGAVDLVVDGSTRVEGASLERVPEPPTPPSEWLPPDDIAPPIVAAGVGLGFRF